MSAGRCNEHSKRLDYAFLCMVVSTSLFLCGGRVVIDVQLEKELSWT